MLGLPKPTAGLMDQLTRFWNRRLERLLAPAGSAIWGEMKQQADAITAQENSGGQILYRCGRTSPSESIGRLNLQNVQAWAAPGAASASTTHGGFDDDETAMKSIISLVKRGSFRS